MALFVLVLMAATLHSSFLKGFYYYNILGESNSGTIQAVVDNFVITTDICRIPYNYIWLQFSCCRSMEKLDNYFFTSGTETSHT